LARYIYLLEGEETLSEVGCNVIITLDKSRWKSLTARVDRAWLNERKGEILALKFTTGKQCVCRL
jgi:hypothetical protein